MKGIEIKLGVFESGYGWNTEDGEGCTESELLTMIGLLRHVANKLDEELNIREKKTDDKDQEEKLEDKSTEGEIKRLNSP